MGSLRTRIFGLFLVLLLAVLSLVLGLVNRSTYQHTLVQIQQQLVAGERVFANEWQSRLLAQQQLTETVAGDFGLKDEVANAAGDSDSLQVALINYRERSRAQLALATDADGRLLAATDPRWTFGDSWPHRELLDEAQSGQGLLLLEGRLYQVHATPIHAPRPVVIGWLLLGFAVDDQALGHVAGLTGASLSLMRVDAGNYGPLASSLDAGGRAALAAALQGHGRGGSIRIDGREQVVLERDLPALDGVALRVVLQQSLTEALADYRPLQWQLAGIVLLALVLAALGAFAVASTVSRPLATMVEYVRRTGEGDYSLPPPQAGGEIGMLSREFAAMQRGIAEREEAIRHAAFHDTLTGLPNRPRFQSTLATTLEQADGHRVAVLLMDLDHFSEINDTLGHVAGDQLLRQIGERLDTQRRGPDPLARLGGDQFALLLIGVDAPEVLPLAQHYREIVRQPLLIEGIALEIDATVGIAMYPDHGEHAVTLLQRAEVAMYQAKDKHLPYAVYNPQADRHSLLRLTLMSELRGAIERGQLVLYVQPKLDVADNCVVGIECLVRWIHPQHGFIPPDEFIGLAEQTGNIRHLTAWVLEEAMSWSRRWQDAGFALKTAVNLSAVDLIDPTLSDRVAKLLARHGLSAESLVLEVTESAVMLDPDRSVALLGQLRGLGLRLSIDDYGTGYSSMAQLKRLPVQELKIDKAFVMDVADNEDDAVIVRSTIELGHNMGLQVVAEGVEHERGFAKLRQFGCDLVQGYWLAKPMPARELQDWLAATAHAVARRSEA